MPPAQNSLQFTNVSDVTFVINDPDIEIYVKGTPLGTINTTTPVSVYVTVNGGGKTINYREITLAEYNNGNTGMETDTISMKVFPRNNPPSPHFTLNVCATNPNRYKIIGWETDTVGQTCSGGNGSDGYFDVSNYLNFKSLMVVTSGQLQMVTKYMGNVNTPYTGTAPLCVSAPFCYVCRP